MRRGIWIALSLIVAAALFLTQLVRNAAADPLVRRFDIALPYPADASRTPFTIALLTDTHLSGPDNSPQRMARIVAQINALRPDLILLGGDYVGDDKGGATYDARAAIAPFAALRAPQGVLAVLGNHDHRSRKNPVALSRPDWRAAFAAIGIRMLDDEAVRRGPLAIGGMRDIYTAWPNLPRMLSAMDRVGGAPVILTHGPDPFPMMPDRPSLVLAGHTHCGQIAFPVLGIIYVPSKYGTRYACGVHREGNKAMVVSAGIGTSGYPVRMLAPPDIWLVTVRPNTTTR